MKHDHEQRDPIALGTARRSTRGSAGGLDDSQGGHYPWPGLSND